MKRSQKHRKYKKHLEDGSTPPRTSRRNFNKVLDDSTSTSTDDQQEFYKLLKHQKVQNNLAVRKRSSKSFTCADEHLDSSNVEVQVSDNTSHINTTFQNQDIEYNFENFEEPVPMDIRLHQSTDCETMDASIYELNNTFCEESESEEEFCQTQNKGHFLELEAKLNCGEFDKTINAHFTVSQAEILYAIQKFIDLYSLPISALEYQCTMLNSFLSESVVPDTKYKIDKLLRSHNSVQYHAVCPTCDIYVRQFYFNERYVECTKCKTNIPLKGVNGNYFVLLNVEKDIKTMIEKHEQYYTAIMINTEREPRLLGDIYDGIEYKKFINLLSEHEKNSFVTCTFNSDGSPVFKSSNYSIWPIQIVLNELPDNVRLNETITVALWFGKNKPKMNIFLKAFVNKINEINTKTISCKINNATVNIKIYPICCCVDAVARAPMQGHIQFNGSYGCGWCYHPGVKVKHTKRKMIKYPLLHTVPKQRTAAETLQHMRTKLTVTESVFGIKEMSSLVHLDYFDIVNGFVPDVMHCVFLGVCRQFAHYWFQEPVKPYSLKNKIHFIDKVLESIQVPQQISRLSRPLKDRNNWNSREWENWLLYYSLPILQSIPEFEIYVQHWQMLVESIYILMSQPISIDELQQAEHLLKQFVGKTEELYSKRAMTFNVHQLLHLRV